MFSFCVSVCVSVFKCLCGLIVISCVMLYGPRVCVCVCVCLLCLLCSYTLFAICRVMLSVFVAAVLLRFFVCSCLEMYVCVVGGLLCDVVCLFFLCVLAGVG